MPPSKLRTTHEAIKPAPFPSGMPHEEEYCAHLFSSAPQYIHSVLSFSADVRVFEDDCGGEFKCGHACGGGEGQLGAIELETETWNVIKSKGLSAMVSTIIAEI